MSRQSVMIGTAQGVTDELNSKTFDIGFEARRSYADWDIRLPDAAGTNLFCDVVPVTFSEAPIVTNQSIEWRIPIDVGFRRLNNQGERNEDGSIKNEVIDPLVALAEEVFLFFSGFRILQSYPCAVLSSDKDPEWMTAYGKTDKKTESMLRLTDQFTSVFRLFFEVTENFTENA